MEDPYDWDGDGDVKCVASTPEEHAFFLEIADDIRSRPDFYREAGEWLDREFADPKALRKRVGVKRRRKFLRIVPLGEAKGECESIDAPTESEGKWVLLITWLLTDPGAHEAGLGLTAFENWPWNPQTASEHDHFACRRYANEQWRLSHEKYQEKYRAWVDLARKAWLATDRERAADAQHGGQEPSTAPTTTGTPPRIFVNEKGVTVGGTPLRELHKSPHLEELLRWLANHPHERTLTETKLLGILNGRSLPTDSDKERVAEEGLSVVGNPKEHKNLRKRLHRWNKRLGGDVFKPLARQKDRPEREWRMPAVTVSSSAPAVRKEMRDEQRRLGAAAQAKCAACKDTFSPYHCRVCDRHIADHCQTCHAEIEHGITPPAG